MKAPRCAHQCGPDFCDALQRLHHLRPPACGRCGRRCALLLHQQLRTRTCSSQLSEYSALPKIAVGVTPRAISRGKATVFRKHHVQFWLSRGAAQTIKSLPSPVPSARKIARAGLGESCEREKTGPSQAAAVSRVVYPTPKKTRRQSAVNIVAAYILMLSKSHATMLMAATIHVNHVRITADVPSFN